MINDNQNNKEIKVITLHNGRKIVFDALIQYICEELEKKDFQKGKFTGFIDFHIFDDILVNYSSEYNLYQELDDWESDYETVREEIERIFDTAVAPTMMVVTEPIKLYIPGIFQDLDGETQEWCNKRKEKIIEILESPDIYHYDMEHRWDEIYIVIDKFKEESIGEILTKLSKI